MKSYITVLNKSEYRFEDRKSVFIGYACPVACENDALSYINEIKKKHPTARHWVYAYVLKENSIARFSDDREPQGTAGMPVLDAIRKNGCVDVLIVVVRYFGGVLLGTGGLVHAYSESAIGALKSARIVTYNRYADVIIEVSYPDYQKLNPLFSRFDVCVNETDFTDTVKITGNVLSDMFSELENKITEVTSGRGKITFVKEQFGFRE